MTVRRIKSCELMEARNISALCFHWHHDTKDITPDAYFEKEMSLTKSAENVYWENTWGSFTEEGEMMGSISVPDFLAEFDGASYKMGGIGAVCTYPQFRNQGVIREIFMRILPDMYEHGYVFSYLYPFSEAFYRKFGYEPSCTAMEMTFSMKTIPSEKYEGSFVLYKDKEQLHEFGAAYEAFAVQYNMCIHRGAYDWKNVTDAAPFEGKSSAYLYQDAQGSPHGYVVIQSLKEDTKVLYASELVFDDFSTLKILLSFLKTFQADYDAVRFRVPSHLNLRHFCTDYAQSKSRIELFQNGMVRVINVKSVLAGAKYKGSGKVRIRLRDGIIIENEKDFLVEFENGTCTCVTDNVIEKNRKTDIELTINQFSAAVIGMYDVEDFTFQDIHFAEEKTEELKKVFYRKGCWINNYF